MRLSEQSCELQLTQLTLPVAHKIYGIPQTINSANYVYFLAYQELQRITPRAGIKVEEMVTGERVYALLEARKGLLICLFDYRGAFEPAPRPGHGPLLAREPRLPDRAGVHRDGQQQCVVRAGSLGRASTDSSSLNRDRRTLQDSDQAHDGRLARTAEVRLLASMLLPPLADAPWPTETSYHSPTSSASSFRSATTTSTCRASRWVRGRGNFVCWTSNPGR